MAARSSQWSAARRIGLTMKTTRHFLSAVWLVVAFSGPLSALADGLPAFIQVGKSYRELSGPIFTVIEVDPSGWVRVRQAGKVFWLNLSRLAGLSEAD